MIIFVPAVDAKPQCVTDSDCQLDEKCYQGSCRLACNTVSCGLNAFCVPQFRKTPPAPIVLLMLSHMDKTE